MKFHGLKRSALIALVAATAAAGTMTTAASSQSLTFRVSAGDAQFDVPNNPSWVSVPGTRVYTVRDDQRPSQDFFRYNNRYYVQNNGRWYRANRMNGRYMAVNERSLPAQFRQVPQARWRAYPPGWQKQQQRRNR